MCVACTDTRAWRLWWDVALVVCVAFNFQPVVGDGRDLLGSGGNSWSWLEGSLDPFLFPRCCLSLPGRPGAFP